jgi:hypothetical protein
LALNVSGEMELRKIDPSWCTLLAGGGVTCETCQKFGATQKLFDDKKLTLCSSAGRADSTRQVRDCNQNCT